MGENGPAIRFENAVVAVAQTDVREEEVLRSCRTGHKVCGELVFRFAKEERQYGE
jgi:hypothetical protein